MVSPPIHQLILYDGPKAYHSARKKSHYDLRQRVLPKNHSARSNSTRNEKYDAKPPKRIESKKNGESHQGSLKATYGRCMGRYLPPNVYHGTHHLYEQRRNKNICHELWYVKITHHKIAYRIAKDCYDIRHHATLTLAKLPSRPPLVIAVGMDKERGQ